MDMHVMVINTYIEMYVLKDREIYMAQLIQYNVGNLVWLRRIGKGSTLT